MLHALVQASNNEANLVGDMWWILGVALCLLRGLKEADDGEGTAPSSA